jgi:UDP:flavonoid glycosyltransferase YjiC (YdhE family)
MRIALLTNGTRADTQSFIALGKARPETAEAIAEENGVARAVELIEAARR